MLSMEMFLLSLLGRRFDENVGIVNFARDMVLDIGTAVASSLVISLGSITFPWVFEGFVSDKPEMWPTVSK